MDADLLLHVVDASSPHFLEQIAEVQRVLAEIGAADIPQLLIFNKLDALDPSHRPLQLSDYFDLDGVLTPRVFLSAKDGEGLSVLRQQLAQTVKRHGTSESDGLLSPEGREAGD